MGLPRRRGWRGIDLYLRYPEPLGGPPEVISYFLSFSKVVGFFGFTQKDHDLKREWNLPAALRAYQTHVVSGEELTDDSLMEKPLLFYRLLHWLGPAHMTIKDLFARMVKPQPLAIYEAFF